MMFLINNINSDFERKDNSKYLIEFSDSVHIV